MKSVNIMPVFFTVTRKRITNRQYFVEYGIRYQGKVNAVTSVFWLPLCFDYCRYLVRVLGFSLPFGISGWTVTGKPKDMTILESDIAKG